MTSKCKHCGYSKKAHDEGMYPAIQCEKSQAEDETYKKFRPIILKQQKGCGAHLPRYFPKAQFCGGKYGLCPSCSNQSPSPHNEDTPEVNHTASGTQTSLSSKRWEETSWRNKHYKWFYDEKDVKTFIAQLKELSKIMDKKNEDGWTIMEIPLEVFDKLAGEKLIK